MWNYQYLVVWGASDEVMTAIQAALPEAWLSRYALNKHKGERVEYDASLPCGLPSDALTFGVDSSHWCNALRYMTLACRCERTCQVDLSKADLLLFTASDYELDAVMWHINLCFKG